MWTRRQNSSRKTRLTLRKGISFSSKKSKILGGMAYLIDPLFFEVLHEPMCSKEMQINGLPKWKTKSWDPMITQEILISKTVNL